MNKYLFRGALISVIFFFTAGCSTPTFDEAALKAENEIGLGNFKKAAKVYEHLIKDYPRDARIASIRLRLGDILANSMGDFADALKQYQGAIETNPASEAARLAHERRADLFEKMSRPEGMVEEYTALLKYFYDHPDSAQYRLRLGEAYITGGEFQQARTELRGFVEKKRVPSELRERALFDIGETYFLESQPGKAVRFYNAFLEEAPKSALAAEAKLRIATCLEEMGYLGTAGRYTKEAGKDYSNKAVIDRRLKDIEKRSKPKKQK